MLELFACVLLCANVSRWSHFAQICIEFAHRQQSRVHSANRNTRTLLYVHFCVGFGEPFDLLEHRAGGSRKHGRFELGYGGERFGADLLHVNFTRGLGFGVSQLALNRLV